MPQTNRNGLVGRYAEFAPEVLSQDEILARVRVARISSSTPDRVGELVRSFERHDLFRYRLGTRRLWLDEKDIDPSGRSHGIVMDGQSMTQAVFALVDRSTDRVDAMLSTFDELRGEGPVLLDYVRREDSSIGPADVLATLAALDVPGDSNDSRLAGEFDVWRDAETGAWEIRRPLHVVIVSFERVNFKLSPTMREQIDVDVVAEEEFDVALLDGPDDDDREAVRAHYLGAAMGRFEEFASSTRPGFSSWMHTGEPVVAKITDAKLYDATLEHIAEVQTGYGSPRP